MVGKQCITGTLRNIPFIYFMDLVYVDVRVDRWGLPQAHFYTRRLL